MTWPFISSFDLINATDFCIGPKLLSRFYFILSVIPFTQCLFLSEREHQKSTFSGLATNSDDSESESWPRKPAAQLLWEFWVMKWLHRLSNHRNQAQRIPLLPHYSLQRECYCQWSLACNLSFSWLPEMPQSRLGICNFLQVSGTQMSHWWAAFSKSKDQQTDKQNHCEKPICT